MEANSLLSSVKIPVIMLTEEEIAAARLLIDEGKLPRDYFEQYRRALAQNVFGHDHKTDRHGEPIEQGIGSPSQPSANSVNAFKRFCKDEPNYERDLARLEKDLAAHMARKKASRGAA